MFLKEAKCVVKSEICFFSEFNIAATLCYWVKYRPSLQPRHHAQIMGCRHRERDEKHGRTYGNYNVGFSFAKKWTVVMRWVGLPVCLCSLACPTAQLSVFVTVQFSACFYLPVYLSFLAFCPSVRLFVCPSVWSVRPSVCWWIEL